MPRSLRGTLTAADVVVEVGIWNYELAQGQFAVAVVVRAVDPVTGEILGRARAIRGAGPRSRRWRGDP